MAPGGGGTADQMITWNDYKKYVRETDPEAAEIIAEAETKAAIISARLEKRDAIGISQLGQTAVFNMPSPNATD